MSFDQNDILNNHLEFISSPYNIINNLYNNNNQEENNIYKFIKINKKNFSPILLYLNTIYNENKFKEFLMLEKELEILQEETKNKIKDNIIDKEKYNHELNLYKTENDDNIKEKEVLLKEKNNLICNLSTTALSSSNNINLNLNSQERNDLIKQIKSYKNFINKFENDVLIKRKEIIEKKEKNKKIKHENMNLIHILKQKKLIYDNIVKENKDLKLKTKNINHNNNNVNQMPKKVGLKSEQRTKTVSIFKNFFKK